MDRRADYIPQKKTSVNINTQQFKIYQLKNRVGWDGERLKIITSSLWELAIPEGGDKKRGDRNKVEDIGLEFLKI